MSSSNRIVAVGAIAMLIGMLPAHLTAQSGTAAVNTQMSIYLAGGNVYTTSTPNGGGISPFQILLTAGTNRILRVAATGTATFCPNSTCLTANPDGPAIGATDLNSSGAISGILAPTSGFLAGVFLGVSLPGAAPSRLNFSVLGTNFVSLSGLALGQTFFIGDGLTSSAIQQQFFVPDGATRLYFGIADGGNFSGNPDFYADNAGTYSANYSITGDAIPGSTVPEPSTVTLMAAGLVALLFARRRKSS